MAKLYPIVRDGASGRGSDQQNIKTKEHIVRDQSQIGDQH